MPLLIAIKGREKRELESHLIKKKKEKLKRTFEKRGKGKKTSAIIPRVDFEY